MSTEELTAEQIQEMRQSFDIIDRDADGFINADDLTALFSAIGTNMTNEDIEQMIKDNDVDGTQKIDFPGFVAILTRKTNETDAEDELREAFRVMDADSDGFITPPELKQLLTNFGIPLSNEVVKKLIADADRNRDAKLDYAEFRQAVLNK